MKHQAQLWLGPDVLGRCRSSLLEVLIPKPGEKVGFGVSGVQLKGVRRRDPHGSWMGEGSGERLDSPKPTGSNLGASAEDRVGCGSSG